MPVCNFSTLIGSITEHVCTCSKSAATLSQRQTEITAAPTPQSIVPRSPQAASTLTLTIGVPPAPRPSTSGTRAVPTYSGNITLPVQSPPTRAEVAVVKVTKSIGDYLVRLTHSVPLMIVTALAALLILGSLLWLLYMCFSRFRHRRARNKLAQTAAQHRPMSVNVHGGDDSRSVKRTVRAMPSVPEEGSPVSRSDRW